MGACLGTPIDASKLHASAESHEICKSPTSATWPYEKCIEDSPPLTTYDTGWSGVEACLYGGEAAESVMVGEMLSSGESSAVYKATWRGEDVAIKRILLPLSMSSRKVGRDALANLEGRIQTSRNHPNITKIHSYTLKCYWKSSPFRPNESYVGTELMLEDHRGSHLTEQLWVNEQIVIGAGENNENNENEKDDRPDLNYELWLVMELCNLGSAKAWLASSSASQGTPRLSIPESETQEKPDSHGSYNFGSTIGSAIPLESLHKSSNLMSGLEGQANPAPSIVSLMYTMVDIARGIRHLHNRDVVLGNLSSSSILLTALRSDESSTLHEIKRKSTIVLIDLKRIPTNVTDQPTSSGSASTAAAAMCPVHQGQASCSSLKKKEGIAKVRQNSTYSNDLGHSASMLYGSQLGRRSVAKITLGLDPRTLYSEDKSRFSTSSRRVYMAPEVLSGRIAGRSADVYAFGILMWELYTGEVPLKDIPADMPAAEFLDEISQKLTRPLFPRDCPLEYQLLATRCWETDHTIRPEFTQIVEDLLRLRHKTIEKKSSQINVHVPSTDSNASPSPGVSGKLNHSWGLPRIGSSLASPDTPNLKPTSHASVNRRASITSDRLAGIFGDGANLPSTCMSGDACQLNKQEVADRLQFEHEHIVGQQNQSVSRELVALSEGGYGSADCSSPNQDALQPTSSIQAYSGDPNAHNLYSRQSMQTYSQPRSGEGHSSSEISEDDEPSPGRIHDLVSTADSRFKESGCCRAPSSMLSTFGLDCERAMEPSDRGRPIYMPEAVANTSDSILQQLYTSNHSLLHEADDLGQYSGDSDDSVSTLSDVRIMFTNVGALSDASPSARSSLDAAGVVVGADDQHNGRESTPSLADGDAPPQLTPERMDTPLQPWAAPRSISTSAELAAAAVKWFSSSDSIEDTCKGPGSYMDTICETTGSARSL